MEKLHIHKPREGDNDRFTIKWETICGQLMYTGDVVSEQEFIALDKEMSANWKRYHNRSIVCGSCSSILRCRRKSEMTEASKKRSEAVAAITAIRLNNDPRLR